MAKMLEAKIMNQDELNYMKEKVETLLSAKGVKIDHPELMEALKKGGAEVCEETKTVKFPKALIDDALAKAPKSFTLAAPDAKNDMVFPHPEGSFYTRTCTGGMNYITENDDYHWVTLEEVGEWTRLINSLENINFCTLPSTSGKEVPAETIDIHTLRKVLQNSTKHIWIQPYEAENVKYLIEMVAAAAGGMEELKKRPIASFITCGTPVLQYKRMDSEILYQCALNGIPMQPCSLPAAGANTPVTLQGTAMVAAAEVLAMIVMAQIVGPGTPCIATPLLFSMDMMTTYTLQSPVEVTMGRMIAMQLFSEGYGLPVHTYGSGTDSFGLDGQSMIERTSTSHMVALSGASVLGGAGQVETAKTISPIQLIIDNDIFGMVKKLKSGMEINDETVNWDGVMAIKGAEGFLATEHTFKHFRDTYIPKTFTREGMPSWTKKGSPDIIAKAKEVYKTIKEAEVVPTVSEEVLKGLDMIVEKADAELVKK